MNTPTPEVADALKQKFYGALNELDDIAEFIEKNLPDRVIYRGRTVDRADVLESFSSAFAALRNAETYLHQHAKNRHAQVAFAKS